VFFFYSIFFFLIAVDVHKSLGWATVCVCVGVEGALLSYSRGALARNVTKATAVVTLGVTHALLTVTVTIATIATIATAVTSATLTTLATTARATLTIQARLGTRVRDVASLATVVAGALIVRLESLRLRVGAVARQVAHLLALEARLLRLVHLHLLVGLVRGHHAIARQMARLLALVARLGRRLGALALQMASLTAVVARTFQIRIQKLFDHFQSTVKLHFLNPGLIKKKTRFKTGLYAKKWHFYILFTVVEKLR
jgi:hypothetical protein